MFDVATLRIVGDSSSLKQMKEETSGFVAAGKNASSAAKGLASSLGSVALAAGGVAAALSPAILFGSAISEAEMFETQMYKIEAVIKATNGVAGRSADQLREQAASLARATLESTEGVLAAQNTLLTFRNVQGDIFDRAVASAADMVAAVPTLNNLSGVAVQLGKALEDPVSGMSALSRSGTVFTEAQKEMVKEMVEVGDIASAQSFILDELEAQYGGAASAAALGLAGAQDSVAQSFQELKLELSDQLGLLDAATAANLVLNDALMLVTDNLGLIISVAGTAAVMYAATWVPSIAAATTAFIAHNVQMAIAAVRFATITASIASTSTAMTVLRTATYLTSTAFTALKGVLVTTGIGALVVGLGTLAYWFSELIKSTGGWGEALDLLKKVASDVWEGIKTSAESIAPALASVFYSAKSSFLTALADMKAAWSIFLSNWGADLSMSGVGALESLGANLISMSAKADASTNALTRAADAASGTADAFKAQADALQTAGSEEISTALAQLQTSVADNSTEMDDATAKAKELASALEETGNTAAGSASSGLRSLEEDVVGLEGSFGSLASTIADAFASLITGASSGSDIVNQFVGSLKSQVTNAISGSIESALLGTVSGSSGGGIFSGSGLSTLLSGGSLLSGIGGAAGGLLGGLGGVLSGGGLGASFANLGGLLSGSVAGLGAIGAAIPAVGVVVALAAGLIGKTELLNSGLRITLEDMDATIEGFQTVKRTRFFGLSTSTNTSTGAVSDEVSDPLLEAIGAMQYGILLASESLGFGAEAFDDFATSIDISTKDLSEEEAVEAIEEAIAGIADEMAEIILSGTDLAMTGETASETLSRLATDLETVNSTLELIGQTVFGSSLGGAASASAISQFFGGADEYSTVFSGYLSAFYSDSEILEMNIAGLSSAFDELGIAMPETRAGFRALVDSLDLSTESGQAMYAALLSMASAMDEVLPSFALLNEQLYGMVVSISSEIDEQITEATDLATESGRAASLWYDAAENLKSFIYDIRGSSAGGYDVYSQFRSIGNQYQEVLGLALSGDIDATNNFSSVANSYLDAALATATSSAEYQKIVATVLNDAQLLQGAATLEGASLDVLEDLYEQQAEILESLKNFLSYEDLTEEQLALLSDDVKALVEDWDGTLETFEDALQGIESAVEQVSDLTYEALNESLNVTLNMIINSDLPEGVKKMLSAETEAIDVLFDFVLRQELPPDALFLAVAGVSEHLTTVNIVLGENDLTKEEMFLALETASTATRTIEMILTSPTLSDEELVAALASTYELSRVINLYLAEDVDPALRALALNDINEYLVVIQTALSPDITDDMQALIFEDAGTYALVVEVALELPPEEAILLLESASTHVLNVYAILQTPGLTEEEQMILTTGSSDALLSVAISLVYSDQLTDQEIEMLQSSGIETLAVIKAGVNLSASSLDQKFLKTITDYSEVVGKSIDGVVSLTGLTSVQEGFLNAINGSSSGSITLDGGVQLQPDQAFKQWYGDTTKNQIQDPMDSLRQSLNELREVMKTVSDQQELAIAQQQLASMADARDAQVQSNQELVNSIIALEEATGVDIRNNGQDAVLQLNENGQIQYAATHVEYDPNNSDLEAFAAAFWAEGGYQSQISDSQNAITEYNSQMNALRRQIEALGGVPAYASGTPPWGHRGGLALVGEKGPELVNIPGGSTVASNVNTTKAFEDVSEELKSLRRELMKSQQRLYAVTKQQRDFFIRNRIAGIPVRNGSSDFEGVS